MRNPSTLCAAFFPNWRDNPYLDLLEAALLRAGVDVDSVNNEWPYRSWLANNRNSIDVLHFHWLSQVYRNQGFLSGMVELMKFGIRLRKAKTLDYRIIWTMHNRYPHERSYPILDQSIRRLILNYSDAVLVHCRAAAKILRGEFDWNGQVVIAPQGNYIGAYENSCSRTEARRYLGIQEDSKLFLHLGAIRQYKGLEQLISSFRHLSHEKATLVIAGRQVPENWFSKSDTFAEARSDPRIVTKLTWIENNDIQYYLNAADYFVAPFKDILSSGSLILAVSFGKPVIAPRLGCLPELIPSSAGFLYDPSDEYGLERTFRRAIESDSKEMGVCAFEVARSLDWDETARLVLTAYSSNGN